MEGHLALDRELKLPYAAPERLVLDGFLACVLALGFSSIAFDEARCISHWGHDVRPAYRQLGLLRARAPRRCAARAR